MENKTLCKQIIYQTSQILDSLFIKKYNKNFREIKLLSESANQELENLTIIKYAPFFLIMHNDIELIFTKPRKVIFTKGFIGNVEWQIIDNKVVSSLEINHIIETYKMETAIAKKEADTSAHATKSHIDSEKAFVESLLREKERKDITPQEREDLNNRIEAAEIRMHEAEKEARQQTEESPYRRSITWGRIAIGAVIVGTIGYGGCRLFGKFVA